MQPHSTAASTAGCGPPQPFQLAAERSLVSGDLSAFVAADSIAARFPFSSITPHAWSGRRRAAAVAPQLFQLAARDRRFPAALFVFPPTSKATATLAAGPSITRARMRLGRRITSVLDSGADQDGSRKYDGRMTSRKRHPLTSGLRQHSLGLVVGAILAVWFVLYVRGDPSTHSGAFYGNALADWLGSFMIVITTKYFYELGSAESRQPHPRTRTRLVQFVIDHSADNRAGGHGWCVGGAVFRVGSARKSGTGGR